MENKSFAELLNKFYTHGLFKEVYRSENAIVCNVLDQFYVAFSLKLINKYSEDFPGFVMKTLGLRAVLEDDNFINNYFQYLSPKDQKKALVILSEDSFQRLLSQKEELKNSPPKLDLQFEQEVPANGKAALNQEKSTLKQKLFGFWKRK